jgi:Flp pilus assembly protein TadG
LDFSSDRGAVTAEFMLLLPALLFLLAATLGIFQIGLERIWLEVRAFEAARTAAIGFTALAAENLEIQVREEGRFRCVTVSKTGLLRLEATRCMIPYGG